MNRAWYWLIAILSTSLCTCNRSAPVDLVRLMDLWIAASADRAGTTLHATILTLMGLDPNGLTSFFNGLDQKLGGVEGAEPIPQVIA